MRGKQSVEFLFRVWVHPEDGDPPEVEVWVPELLDTRPVCQRRCAVTWAEMSFADSGYDFWDLFDLPKDQDWQVVGRAKITGSFDYWGEYDEDLEILEFEKAVVPEEYFQEKIANVVRDGRFQPEGEAPSGCQAGGDGEEVPPS